MSDRTLLLAGNWKMNHDHLEAISSVQKLAWALEDAKLDDSACEVVVIPPFTDIRSVQTLVQGDKLWLKYGAQDVSQHAPGAHTGEIAASFLSRLRCSYVVIGHSERRADNHETNETVAAKLRAAVEAARAPQIRPRRYGNGSVSSSAPVWPDPQASSTADRSRPTMWPRSWVQRMSTARSSPVRVSAAPTATLWARPRSRCRLTDESLGE